MQNEDPESRKNSKILAAYNRNLLPGRVTIKPGANGGTDFGELWSVLNSVKVFSVVRAELQEKGKTVLK